MASYELVKNAQDILSQNRPRFILGLHPLSRQPADQLAPQSRCELHVNIDARKFITSRKADQVLQGLLATSGVQFAPEDLIVNLTAPAQSSRQNAVVERINDIRIGLASLYRDFSGESRYGEQIR